MNSQERRINVLVGHLGSHLQANVEKVECASSATHPSGLVVGQVAIITGSGNGIGAEAAHLFAKEGAKVVVSDLDPKKSEDVAAQIRNAGGDAIAIPGDITDPVFPENLVKATIEKYGKINIIINNAGYTWDGVAHKITDQQWDAMIKVHCTGPFRLIRAAAPYFRVKSSEPRSIINISSTSGLHGNFGQLNYSTAKMGIIGFTKTLAKEWGAFGVRVNAIAYGYIDTRLTRAKGQAQIEIEGKKIDLGIPQNPNDARSLAHIPLQRGGTVEDAAGAMLLLASPFASYITGHTLEVTGGVGI